MVSHPVWTGFDWTTKRNSQTGKPHVLQRPNGNLRRSLLEDCIYHFDSRKLSQTEAEVDNNRRNNRYGHCLGPIIGLKPRFKLLKPRISLNTFWYCKHLQKRHLCGEKLSPVHLYSYLNLDLRQTVHNYIYSKKTFEMGTFIWIKTASVILPVLIHLNHYVHSLTFCPISTWGETAHRLEKGGHLLPVCMTISQRPTVLTVGH